MPLGRCTKGNACEYRHIGVRISITQTRRWMESLRAPVGEEERTTTRKGGKGKPAENSGANPTNNPDKSKESCKFHKEGRCKFGNECKFSHKGNPDKAWESVEKAAPKPKGKGQAQPKGKAKAGAAVAHSSRPVRSRRHTRGGFISYPWRVHQFRSSGYPRQPDGDPRNQSPTQGTI